MKKILSCLVLFCICCGGCENDLQQVQQLNTRDIGVEVAKNIETYYYSANGQIKAKMTAPQLHRYMKNPPYMEINNGLRVDFYNDSLQVESILTAKKGYFNEGNNEMWVKDSVVVINREGRRLDCQDLYWDAKKQQFYTHNPATITSPTEVLYGRNGLTANQDFSSYQILHTSGLFQDSTMAP
ncbi:LPS export ABC transporter periplasmic protein LptC [Compostibacter hankyongensis]|uniref:LPS export ABC transporter periplasmic protein LptC n=1 Tax=Compostibacter hankyongensis TaxID=1007089 RepID=A0ABP8FDP1_9BACT